MVARKRRKAGKYLGSRTWGCGNKKNRRGKGCRGGSGNAGVKEHRRTYFTAYDMDHIGRHGFVSQTRVEVPTININDINRMVDNGDIKKTGDKYEYSFKGKVLGSGKLAYPVLVNAKSFSKKAVEKLGKAGGKATTE